MASNAKKLKSLLTPGLGEVLHKFGKVVHVPHSAFPSYKKPELGYWVGETVDTDTPDGKRCWRFNCW